MIPLPPGCRCNYAIVFEVTEITDEMCEWFVLIGGYVFKKESWNSRGSLVEHKYVQYGKAKPCYYRQDGSKEIKIHFDGGDASTASVFLIKFFDQIVTHNMKEAMEKQYV